MQNNEKKSFKEIIECVVFGIRISFAASTKLFLFKSIILCFKTIIPILYMQIWERILNQLSFYKIGNAERIWSSVCIYLILYVSVSMTDKVNEYISSRFDDAVIFYIEKVMMDKTSRMPLEYYDCAKMGDKIVYTRNNFNTMTEMAWLVFDILSEMVNIILSFVILCRFNIFIGFFSVVFLIPYFVFQKYHTERLLKMQKKQVRDQRKLEYFLGAFDDNRIQFEIKLNGIGKYFIKCYSQIWTKNYKINMQEDIRYNLKNILFLLLGSMGDVLVLVVSILKAVNNEIGLGTLQYNLSISALLKDQAMYLMYDINMFISNSKRIGQIREFVDHETRKEQCGKLIPKECQEIEFDKVYFKYPGENKYVLENCSFVLSGKEKTALVGKNGSGKSTIISLILRFYDVSGGEIKLNGININDYDIYALRELFGTLFQDYVSYCLPIREIIGLSDFRNVFNDKKLFDAINKAGGLDFLEQWSSGLDTIIGRFYADNGKDLSGGQWQLVSLARAYFKNSMFMILDEPSAALDPVSEKRIFEQEYQVCQHKGSIIVTHQLVNVVNADRVIVLKDGRIIEQGNHEELLNKKSHYAYLYNLQAERYKS